MSEKSNFKVIVALKSAKDQKVTNVRCAIQLMDKVKYTILPQAEGQFFDLNYLSLSNPLTITFDTINTQRRLGVVAVQIPSDVYSQQEVELADIFTLDYQGDSGAERFTGRYYIIILNKGGITSPPEDDASFEVVEPKKEKREQSPTKAYLQSSNERNQERQKKDQSKKLLKETKYDPPKKPQFTSFSGKAKTSSGKKSESGAKDTKQFEENDALTTPKKHENGKSTDFGDKQSPFQRYSEKAYSSAQQQVGELGAEVEFLKTNAVGLEKQLKLNESNKDINERLNDELSRSEAKRRELQQIIRESVQDNLTLKEEIQKNLSDMAKEKLGVESKLRQQNQLTEEQLRNTDSLKQNISLRDKKISELLDKVLAMEEFSKICRIQQEKLEDQDKSIKDSQQQFQKNIQDLAINIQDLEQQRLQAYKERAQTDQTLQELIQQMQRLKEHNISLQALVEQLERKYQIAQAYEQSAKALKEQNAHLQNEVQDGRHLNDQLNALIQQLRRDIENLNQQHEANDKLNRSKHQSLGEVLKGLETRMQDVQNENGRLKKENLVLKEQVSTLTTQASLAEDLQKQVDQYKKDYNNLLEDNTKLTSTISDLTDQLQLSNQQILELRNEVLRQSGLVQDQEQYTNNLKKLMLEMQERGVTYIPATGDNIDGKLAQWINKSQDADKYKQLFVREGEGVYQFGNKKVYVKVEQDKILIRSGGGYMTIEEFLQMFSQREMENLQRADPLAALAKNKAVYKKMDNMKQVSQFKGNEISPLKKKGTTYGD